jgi:fructokinase
MTALFGGIEAGGTKFVCVVGTGPDDIRASDRFSTTTPEVTLGRVIEFFRGQEALHGSLAAIGIGAFGPLDPNPHSSTFGHITSTPKPGWANVDFVGRLRQVFDVPMGFDTDVNAAALAEGRWGAARGLDTFVYLTIGTGIGGGAMVNGHLLHGMIHPEMGHMLLRRDPQVDTYGGFCPFHVDCFEGLAAGPAIEKRWGQRAETLAADHPAWALEAHYLALGVVNLVVALSPQRVVMGGGVMEQPQLFPLVRAKVQTLLNGYVRSPQITDQIDEYIVAPALGGRAGVLGAIALAGQAADRSA